MPYIVHVHLKWWWCEIDLNDQDIRYSNNSSSHSNCSHCHLPSQSSDNRCGNYSHCLFCVSMVFKLQKNEQIRLKGESIHREEILLSRSSSRLKVIFCWSLYEIHSRWFHKVSRMRIRRRTYVPPVRLNKFDISLSSSGRQVMNPNNWGFGHPALYLQVLDSPPTGRGQPASEPEVKRFVVKHWAGIRLLVLRYP